MSVTQNSEYRGVNRITRDDFRSLLTANAAPVVLAERDAGEYWDAIQTYHADALFIAAIFMHESQMGKKGTATQTHSWGNTRTPNFGAQSVGTVPGRSGTFPVFANWLDGCISTVARLTDPTWVYAKGDRTIGEVFTVEPSWAPAGDMNDPDGYLRAVLDFMNAHESKTGDTATVATLWYPEAKRASTPYQNDGASNGRRFPATVTDVVMHHTDGSYASAIAWFEETGRGSGGTSAHFVISRTGEVTQLVALDSIAWHAGNWDENVRSIGIEHEQSQVNGQWQDWPDVLLDASAKLLTWLMGQMTAGFNVYPHKNFTSTTCPGNLPIDEIVKRIGQPATQAPAQPAAKPDTRWFPETRHYLSHGFLRFWEENGGLAIFGLPLSEEFTGPEGFTVQWLERAQFQYQPTIASNQWGVVLARIGADAMANDRNKNPQAFTDAEPPK